MYLHARQHMTCKTDKDQESAVREPQRAAIDLAKGRWCQGRLFGRGAPWVDSQKLSPNYACKGRGEKLITVARAKGWKRPVLPSEAKSWVWGTTERLPESTGDKLRARWMDGAWPTTPRARETQPGAPGGEGHGRGSFPPSHWPPRAGCICREPVQRQKTTLVTERSVDGHPTQSQGAGNGEKTESRTTEGWLMDCGHEKMRNKNEMEE